LFTQQLITHLCKLYSRYTAVLAAFCRPPILSVVRTNNRQSLKVKTPQLTIQQRLLNIKTFLQNFFRFRKKLMSARDKGQSFMFDTPEFKERS
jgi:hypothetical protein